MCEIGTTDYLVHFIYLRKKINLNRIVVYNQKKMRTRRDIDAVAKKLKRNKQR